MSFPAIVLSSVSRDECRLLGLSRILSFDRHYLAALGCHGRMIVCGWTIEFFGPCPPRKEPTNERAIAAANSERIPHTRPG